MLTPDVLKQIADLRSQIKALKASGRKQIEQYSLTPYQVLTFMRGLIDNGGRTYKTTTELLVLLGIPKDRHAAALRSQLRAILEAANYKWYATRIKDTVIREWRREWDMECFPPRMLPDGLEEVEQ